MGMTTKIEQYHRVLLQIVYPNTSLGKKDLVSILGFSWESYLVAENGMKISGLLKYKKDFIFIM
jgi:hypothetical protein